MNEINACPCCGTSDCNCPSDCPNCGCCWKPEGAALRGPPEPTGTLVGSVPRRIGVAADAQGNLGRRRVQALRVGSIPSACARIHASHSASCADSSSSSFRAASSASA